MTRVDLGAAVREALVLPLVFLTTGLVAAMRVSPEGVVSFSGPPLMSLVLAMLLVGLAIQSGLLVPERCLSDSRTALANLNGAAVLVTLVFATAQVFAILTPPRGLLNAGANVFFLTLLLTTLAAATDARRLLRSLVIVFGTALVCTHVVLAQLVAPGGSLAKRLLATALEGITLGALGATPQGAATGYFAFFAVVLLLVGLLLLPRRVGVGDGLPPRALDRAPERRSLPDITEGGP